MFNSINKGISSGVVGLSQLGIAAAFVFISVPVHVFFVNICIILNALCLLARPSSVLSVMTPPGGRTGVTHPFYFLLSLTLAAGTVKRRPATHPPHTDHGLITLNSKLF